MCENATESTFLGKADCPMIICPDCKSDEIKPHSPKKEDDTPKTTRSPWQCQNCKAIFV